MARTLHPSSVASMSANGQLKPSKLKKKKEKKKTRTERSSGISCGRIPHNKLTHPLNLSRLNTVWASPEGRAEG